MNAIQPSDFGAPAPRKPTRQQTTTQTLKTVQRVYLSLSSDFAQLSQEFEDLRRQSNWQAYFLVPPLVRVFAPSTEEQRSKALAFAQLGLDMYPDFSRMEALLDRCQEAAAEEWHENRVRTVVAAMIDSFPNARPHSPETYLESQVHYLQHEGVSNAAVALACNEIVRSSTFLPSVAEVLEKAKAKDKSLRTMTSGLARVIDWAERTREAIPWLESVALAEQGGPLDRTMYPGNDPW